tara:strand:+ start:136 stop:477 length:342 start_codon:yes stop_codon:yes gene_type:complete
MFYESNHNNSIDLSTPNRSALEQSEVDRQTAAMALYHYEGCYFSAKVKKAIAVLKLKIELRDILAVTKNAEVLLKHGGKTTVPCLYIEKTNEGTDTWMYESDDIIRYLKENFE